MKERADFVSNSSSCSFIIEVKTDDDASQIKKKLECLKKSSCNLMFTDSVENAMNSWFEYALDNKSQVEKGIYIQVDNGDDHDEFRDSLNFYEDLQDIADLANEGYGRLHFYRDDDAHVSLGDDLRKRI